MRDALGCAKLSKVQERLEDGKRMVLQSSPRYADSLYLIFFSNLVSNLGPPCAPGVGLLISCRGAEHAQVVECFSDDLHPSRNT
jgi:hypothetical protein